jgi:transcriptional regulator with XRE-family HTH domain
MRKYDDIYLERIFSERLKEALDENLVSGEDLETLGIVSASNIDGYLKRKSLPQLRTIVRIAEYLGVSIDWLCGIE